MTTDTLNPVAALVRVTRRTKTDVWIRLENSNHGSPRKLTWVEFKARYLPVSKRDGLDKQLYLERTNH